MPEISHAIVSTQMPVGMLSSPEVMLVQTPTLPTALHTRHAVSHELAQQTPSMQKLLTQSVAPEQPCASSFLHTPAPSHELVPVQPGRSSLAFGTLMQVPTLPGTLHDLHADPHPALQHTPSTQKPLKQSTASIHAALSIFLHAPAPLHTVPPD